MFTEKDIPPTLFKYRSWDDPYHKRLLTHCELYFASFDQFNDPFDGAVPFKYDQEQLTKENIFLKMYEVAKHQNPDWDDKQIHAYCYEHQRRGYLLDEQYVESLQEDIRTKTNSRFGIVSLAELPNNYLLWSHYSSSHTGFCVGFNSRKLFDATKGMLGPVSYQHDLPLIDLFGDEIEFGRKLLFTKGKHWEYEDEYRLVRPGYSRKKAYLPLEVFECLVFGYKMDQKDKFSILELLEEKHPNVTIYEAKLSTSKFELDLIPIK